MEPKTGKYRRRAEKILEDPGRLNRLIEEGVQKAETHKEKLQGLFQSLMALFRLVKAYAVGEYRAVPWKSMMAAVTALVYFIYPLDFIPDFLLPGFLDDALVVGWVLSSIKQDLDIFIFWEKMNATEKLRLSQPS